VSIRSCTTCKWLYVEGVPGPGHVRVHVCFHPFAPLKGELTETAMRESGHCTQLRKNWSEAPQRHAASMLAARES
jgi:hypothetical protein